jgi:hypothetical protein
MRLSISYFTATIFMSLFSFSAVEHYLYELTHVFLQLYSVVFSRERINLVRETSINPRFKTKSLASSVYVESVRKT